MENSSLQPTLVTGGSLRPYQLKGLAWLKVLLTVIFMALKEGITKQFFKVLLEVVSFKVKDQTRLCDFRFNKTTTVLCDVHSRHTE